MPEIDYKWSPSPHTADLAIKIESLTVEGIFHACLEGLLGLMDIPSVSSDYKITGMTKICLQTCILESAVIDFLNECIYIMEVNDVIPCKIELWINIVEAYEIIVGTKTPSEIERSSIGHIKAATYSDFNIEAIDGKYHARIIFDT